MIKMMTTTTRSDNDDYDSNIIGVIIPPTDIKTIVDKTAEFVANNGPEFEQKLLQGNDTGKFNFLKTEHPYNAYYKEKVHSFFNAIEEQEENEEEAMVDQNQKSASPTTLATTATTSTTTVPAASSTTIISKKADVILSSTSARREKPKTDPLKYIYEIPVPPTMTALEYDLIKLTAQYAAANGKQFLTSITIRENNNRNPLFAFLQPTNKHFKFFVQISAVYSRIVNPELPLDLNIKHQQQQEQQSEETIIDKLKFLAEPSNKAQILDLMYQKAEWETVQDQERRKQNAHDESESTAVSAIDWHDFVVVETIDFDDDDEEEEEEDVEMEVKAEEEEEMFDQTSEQLAHISPHHLNYPKREEEYHDRPIEMDTSADDGEMDTTEDEEQTKPIPAKSTLLLLDDDQELERRIRKNYVKKEKGKTTQGTGGYDPSKFFKDQTTGELIPIDQAEKHMRIKTIDPRWKEQKEREMEKFKTTNIATDVEITDQLMSMVKRRTQNAEPKEEPASTKPVIWDGHKTSAAYVTQQTATLGTVIPDPQAPSPNLPMYGPTVPTTFNLAPTPHNLAHIQAQAQAAALAATFTPLPPGPTITPPGLPLLPPPPHPPGSFRPPPPGFIPPFGVPPLTHTPLANPAIPGVVPAAAPRVGHPRPESDPNALPSSKRQKTNE